MKNKKSMSELFEMYCMYASSKNAKGLITTKFVAIMAAKHGFKANDEFIKQFKSYCKAHDREFELSRNENIEPCYYIAAHQWVKDVHHPSVHDALVHTYIGKTITVFHAPGENNCHFLKFGKFTHEIKVNIVSVKSGPSCPLLVGWNDECDELVVYPD